MKQLGELLKGARRIEFWIAAAAVCALLALALGGGTNTRADDVEARMERILSRIEGAGRVTVMLSGVEGAPEGAVVAASGADSARVVLELQRAVQALTGLELGKIEIVKSKG